MVECFRKFRVVHLVVWMLKELLTHRIYWHLEQQNKEEELRIFNFTTAVGVDNGERFWRESFEILIRVVGAAIREWGDRTVEIFVRHRQLASFGFVACENLVDFFWPTEESYFVLIETSHLFSAIDFFALAQFFLLAYLIKIHQSKGSEQKQTGVVARVPLIFLLVTLPSSKKTSSQGRNRNDRLGTNGSNEVKWANTQHV